MMENATCVAHLATPEATRIWTIGAMEFTPEQRSLRARIAAYALHASHDPRETTKPARAFMARFERQVDPDGKLPKAERRRRADAAKKAYFNGLALKSARATGGRRERGGGAPPEPARRRSPRRSG